MSRFDLVVYIPDADYEQSLKVLFKKRLPIPTYNIRPFTCDPQRHPNRDSGVYQEAPELLRSHLKFATRALIFLDYHGSGQDHKHTPEEIESQLEGRMIKNGWLPESCAAIVLDPEIELWVWSSSGRARIRSLTKHSSEAFEAILQKYPSDERGKPKQPKEAFEAVFKHQRPISPSLFAELAESVSLKTEERAFNKLRTTLQSWFPLDSVLPPDFEHSP